MSSLADARVAFPGRFQPLHRGHYRVIRAYREIAGSFVVALGSPGKSRTAENPLTATERERLLGACFPALDVARVPDEDRGEAGYPVWGRRLVERTDADVVLSGNDLVRRIVREHTDARPVEQDLHQPERFSGTEVRRRIRADESWRPLVPSCCRDELARYTDIIARTGEA
ncbi:adenylyltransferase/cytidyltransferase family protein [Halarchaeum sp. P4]|uniref:adenylyltransferase/cytidyltransferase family protein n=1 Tax=Halarchaeum sp. P4 TaxID=3421639 RepID=UPI003EB924CF